MGGRVNVAYFRDRGVAFVVEGIDIRVRAAKGSDGIIAELRDEVQRRADLMRPGLPLVVGMPIGIIPIVSPPPEQVRVGACHTCGEELPAHRGGGCMLCHLGRKKAFVDAGWLS